MKKANTVIILGSSRSHGDTRQVADFLAGQTGSDLIDLNDFDISYFDYEHRNAGDDFLPLMERVIANYDRIVFATPVYWYSMSAVMKTFFDRLSDLLKIRKELGRQLRGKSMAVLSCSRADDVDYDFEIPFRLSANYLGMDYLGHLHAWTEGGAIAAGAMGRIERFLPSIISVPEKNSDIGTVSNQHIIGEFEGEEHGPLLIVMAGMHGNEPAGVLALETVFQLLEREPKANPDFHFRGKIVGLLGNSKAYGKRKRLMTKDLNRLWTPGHIRRVLRTDPERLHYESLELRELIDTIEAQIDAYQPEHIVLLDLHTTSAGGGIFAIATDEPLSVRIATDLRVPVITGMLRTIQGTTLHFFTKENLQKGLRGADMSNCKTVTGVAFEAGQHDDPLSENRCIAAIINCMRCIGSVNREVVENRYEDLLRDYSKDLPKIAELVKVHSIGPLDGFRMQPGYQNFQPVKQGELLAEDRHGPILCPEDGLILMPLYQPQGSDGFFLVKKIA